MHIYYEGEKVKNTTKKIEEVGPAVDPFLGLF